ncbi:MAG: putative cytochrome P450 123 [Acidimicrobiales bacterium]|nr:MAG: cytochrome P450 [Actinomycetota bacterium]MBV6509036.1 putative cytochrome P450 123 [Acidimicrobiales bacterium]RIK06383.1 MAG: cytochrome P450 [Acidobacteriota bacterium]
MTATEILYDPYDYAIDADPYPVWKRLRDEAPLYYNEQYDFWALSRFGDVHSAHLDHETFSSAHGTVIEMMTDEPGESSLMIFMDPPAHNQLRKLVSRAFTPRRVNRLEGRIRQLCAGYLDPHLGADGFDYVADFGARLPVMVISSLLGIPEEDQDWLREMSDLMLHREPGETGPSPEAVAAVGDLLSYWQDHIDRRRAEPVEDIMSELVHSEMELGDGTTRPLDDGELHSFIGLLSAAGNETVARLLGFAATTLARNPDQREHLVEDASLIPNAVEELLRYEAPSPIQARWVTRDVELHDVVVPRGSKITLLTGSAGRDDREFDEPDRFDVNRRIERHLSFGYGVHYCLGASLARLEGRVALEETLRRFPVWDIDEDALEMVHTSTVRGYARVPIGL